ncbi:TPA: hypothetical protein N0F65_012879 [Lagenidium giganteum]|uniref:Coiled-coil domain-containing protein 130 n=1 Tax=Lagenidium giganteum TaxID=4803 RepID=A0AAV2YJB3_9STRA|nr:TPA: hypothetical protein N0F65_012879 [Lagenidium giganteum]
MSSLAAARADNFYYPQGWTPEDGSLNKFHKSHPLGKRAKDIAQGILVVRFEMPFNVWCLHCRTHIGRGVRFNAKKKHVDKYLSTPIYEFRMDCASCQGELVIRTDPAARGYNLVSGVQQKAEEFTAEDVETERLNDSAVGEKIAEDPFFRLEHENEDKRRAQQRATGLAAIIEVQDAQCKDNYASNSALRAKFRKEKKALKKNQVALDKLGLSIKLVAATQDDVIAAKSVAFQTKRGGRATATGKTASRRPAVADSFQHFGDSTVASQLHRLKVARAAKAASGTKRVRSATTSSSIEKRASKLARR